MRLSGDRIFGVFVVILIAALALSKPAIAGEELLFPAFPTLRFTEANIVEVPPGEVRGQVSLPDGTTPGTFMRVLLIDPDTGDEMYSTNTGADGRFTLSDVDPGRYLIRVGLPGVIYILDVKPGATPDPLPKNVVRLPAGDILGGVALTGGEIPSAELVKLIDPETGEVLMSTTTDEDGKFIFEDVPEGTYLVKVESPGLVLTLEVSGDQPGFLDIIVPRIAMLPVVDERSVAPFVINVMPGAVVGGGYYWYRASRRRSPDEEPPRRRTPREISPIMP